jgi:hypothetical protein
MYDKGMEIMVPSQLKTADAVLSSQYLWTSEDKRLLISVVKGSADLQESGIDERLDSYLGRLGKDITGFEKISIKKLRMHGKTYGEIRYHSHMIYDYFNMFILGIYNGREIICTIQCLEEYAKKNLHIFEYILDSIRII